MTMATSRKSYLQYPGNAIKGLVGIIYVSLLKHQDIFATPPCKFRRVRLNLFGTAAVFYSVCKRLDVNFLIEGRT